MYNAAIRLGLFIILLSPLLAQSNGTNYYVTQSGAGSRNGLSLENAWGLADLNNGSNWASIDTAAKIDPGDTVYLNGVISNEITVRGSGTDGNPVTIDGTNATISVDIKTTDKIIYIYNQQYLVLQNLTINGLDSAMMSSGSRAAIYVRQYGAATGHITIQNSHIIGSCSGILLQGDVTHVNVYRNNFESMANYGISVVIDEYDGDNVNGYDDCPSYVTIGGSSENGNTFKNIGYLTSDEWANYATGYRGGGVPGAVFGTTVKDAIFSYNHVYSDKTDVGAGIYLNGAKRVLVEYNTIHGLEAVNHRSYINFKTDHWLYSEDIVVRFNKIYDIYDGLNQYASPGDAIRVEGEGKNRLIYGNYCEGAGINLGWNWTADNDNIGGDGYFVWSNIINQTAGGGGVSISGTWENTDEFKNFYIYNNTIYRAVLDTENPAYFYAISDSVGNVSAIVNGIHVKNNIIYNSRPNASEHVGISLTAQDDLAVDYNHHLSTNNMPLVQYNGSECDPCDWNSADRPSGYGVNDTEGDPLFTNPSSANLALQPGSPAINTGADLSADDRALPELTIQGVNYTFSFSMALNPTTTNWLLVPPQVGTANQNNYGQWEKGAYVFTIDSLPAPKIKIGS